MTENIFRITALGLFAGAFCIVIAVFVWNRRLAKVTRECEKLAKTLAEAKLQTASWLKIIPGAVYRSKPDAARTMVFVSDAITPVTGYPPADFTSRLRHYSRMIHPEDQAVAEFQIEQGLKRNRSFEVEYRICKPDGKIRRIIEKGVGSGPGKDNGCGYAWIDGVIIDITGPKQNDEALRMRDGMLRSLIEAVPDLIFFKDRKGVYLECNKAFALSVGKEPEEIIGKTDYDLFDGNLADRFRETDLKTLSKIKPRQSLEKVFSADGRKTVLEMLKTPLIDADGKVVGLVGVSRDVTDDHKNGG